MTKQLTRDQHLTLAKSEIPILLLEGIADTAPDTLRAAGYTNVTRVKTALDVEELKERLEGVRMLGIRSRTRLTADIFEAAPRLIAVGCFSVGTNQVDLSAAAAAGIPVFNAPFSNTRSVAELTIAEIIMLYRRVFPRSMAAHQGKWDKSAKDSHEIRGRTLGIVGYGNIGTQLANLAEVMGMSVIYHDQTDKLRHGNVIAANDLMDLLARSDIVSLHLPETPQTKGIIGEREIRAMKPGSFLINNARGSLVDIDALAAALEDGHLRGAAIDVFPSEPSSNEEEFVSPLRGLDNVILTPHVGGSTEEAQQRIGDEVARKLIEYSDVGSTTGAVNFPQVQLPMAAASAKRFIHIHHNVPGMMRRLNNAFGERGVNITAQYLQTEGELGYVVLDAQVTEDVATDLLAQLRGMEGTIRSRMVYGPTVKP
ncbi:MAG: phosphoglycerate dehydrogenase [Dichotomicrobium sp.]